MTAVVDRPVVSSAQYHALQAPVVLPTPQELFDFEVLTLKDKGFDLAPQDVDRLRALVPKQPQFFLLLPPKPDQLDLPGLMALVEVDGKTGKNYLDPQYLADLTEEPAGAYLLLDIEDSRKRLNIRPRDSRENIRSEGRLAYTVWRGLLHAIVFPCTLQDHNLDLVGSRYRSKNVPYLSLYDEVPKLYSYLAANANPKWGAPSAGSVVGA